MITITDADNTVLECDELTTGWMAAMNGAQHRDGVWQIRGEHGCVHLLDHTVALMALDALKYLVRQAHRDAQCSRPAETPVDDPIRYTVEWPEQYELDWGYEADWHPTELQAWHAAYVVS